MLFSEKDEKNCGQACQTVDKSTQKHPFTAIQSIPLYQIYPLLWTKWTKKTIYPKFVHKSKQYKSALCANYPFYPFYPH